MDAHIKTLALLSIAEETIENMRATINAQDLHHRQTKAILDPVAMAPKSMPAKGLAERVVAKYRRLEDKFVQVEERAARAVDFAHRIDKLGWSDDNAVAIEAEDEAQRIMSELPL